MAATTATPKAVNVPRRGRATLVLPFGTWYGEPAARSDLRNIVSLQVMVDKPGRSRRIVVGSIRAVRFDESEMKEVFDDPFFKQLRPVFGRGVNLANALEAPRKGDWGVVLKEEYFDRIEVGRFRLRAAAGPLVGPCRGLAALPNRSEVLRSRRLGDRPVAPAADHADREHAQLRRTGAEPDKHRRAFVALWRQIAEHYQGYPRALAFELFNEPNGNLTADKWNQLLAETITVVRRTNPHAEDRRRSRRLEQHQGTAQPGTARKAIAI